MLSTAEITAMRTVQNQALPDTGIVYRLTRTTDGMGGFTESWAAVGTANCRIAPSGGQEATVAGKLSSIGTWSLTFANGQDVRAADRVTVGAQTFAVETTAAGSVDGSWQTALRVVASEIT